MSDGVARCPNGLQSAGRRLWRSVQSEYELEEHETALLREARRTVDLLDELAAVVAAEGAVISSPQGPRANPAAVEARQQPIVLARVLAALRLPAGDEDDPVVSRRPQRRGIRGVYSVGAA